MKTWLAHPVCVAAIVTGLNALKPAAVDDTAYLLLARQIAAHPLDPYGGELFWYAEPSPALHVLAPPVVPYWLAAGFRLFGEHVPLLKLWLYPFPLVLCYAVRSLARRFAPGYSTISVPAVALSPLVLPLFGVMLDVPALALGLAALAVFVRGGRVSWLGAGVLAGLAMQTKYTAFTVPAAVLLFGITHRRVVPAVLAAVVAAGLFVGWEGLMAATYGESHFLYHVRAQTGDGPEGFALVAEKWNLLSHPLVTYLGGLGFGLCLFAYPAAGVRRWAAPAALATGVGLLLLLVLPYSDTVFLTNKATGSVRLDLPGVFFTTLGGVWFAVLVLGGLPFLLRKRADRATLFLLGWLILELGAYFALSPFPGGRRVMGVGFVGALLFFRAAAVLGRLRNVRPGRWVLPYGIALGVGLFALDVWDARPEPVLARNAGWFVHDHNHGAARVWYSGHWGFQYACDRVGMRPAVPGMSRLAAGDWLVYPAIPDDVGFYRPYHGGAKLRPDPAYVEPVVEFIWLDALSGQTIPPLYGGRYPMSGRDHPRLRVVVYRVIRDWVPERVE
jgi:hypothetical protein